MKVYIGLFTICAAIFLVHYAVAGQAVYGDGIDYWAYLPSWYFDHDQNFENQFRHIYNHEFNNSHPEILAPQAQKTRITERGLVDNPHPPGTAWMLLPFFTTSDILVKILNYFGFNILRNGYSDWYQIIAGWGAIGYAMAGVLLAKKTAQIITGSAKAAKLAAVTIFLAGPLLYYGAYDVLSSHFASFFMVGVFWYLWFSKRRTTRWDYFEIGLIAGMATLIRLQDGLLAIILLIELLKKKEALKYFLPVFLGLFVVTAPLFNLWLYLYGVPWPDLYVKFGHTYRGIWGSWLSPITGWFSRTPVMAVSLFGWPKKLGNIWPLVVYFTGQTMLVIWQGGWHDAAYGGRMYISSTLLFVVLLAFLLIKIYKSGKIKIAYAVIGILIVANMFSIASFVLLEKEVNSGQKRGLEEQTIQKLENLLSH